MCVMKYDATKDNFFENMNGILKENKKIYEPAHEIPVLNTEVTSIDSDMPAHLHCLTGHRCSKYGSR